MFIQKGELHVYSKKLFNIKQKIQIKNNFQSVKNSEKRHQMDRSIKPLSSIKWAQKQEKMYDVFLFLGTSKMDFQNIKKTKASYEAHTNIKTKYVFI